MGTHKTNFHHLERDEFVRFLFKARTRVKTQSSLQPLSQQLMLRRDPLFANNKNKGMIIHNNTLWNYACHVTKIFKIEMTHVGGRFA